MTTATKTRAKSPEKPKKRTAAKKATKPKKPTQGKGQAKRRIEKVYDYLDEKGELVYQNVRYIPKDFRQRRPNPDNPPDLDHPLDANDPDDQAHWIWNLDNTRRILYRLPEILDSVNSIRGEAVFICEGEKDADSLHEIGLIATTNPMGSASWQDEYSNFLTDYRSIVILPDNDQPGKDRAEKIIKSLRSLPGPGIAEIRVIELPGLPEHGDLTDWLNADGSKQKLLILVKDRLPERPDSETETGFPTGRFFPTDVYNADCFVKKYSNRIKYCRQLGWLFYDGKRWNRDIGEVTAAKFSRQTARALYTLLKTARIDEEHRTIFSWFLRSQTDRKIQAVVHLARSYDEILVPSEKLDVDPYIFNCENGTINLRTMEFYKHRPSDMITQVAPVTYDPEAIFAPWLDYLNTWMQGDSEKIDYLQRLGGMCLTGDTCARAFPIFYGSGFNGKSVFLDTLRGLMGDYAWEGPEDLLAEKEYRSHPTEIAALAGKRLVTVSETAKNMRLRTSLIKRMTGDQMQTGRFMRQDSFTFKTTNKTILMTQNKPRITETSNALWDRLHLVPWLYRIPKEDQIPGLTEKLMPKWSPILNWFLDGCRKWRKGNGSLEPPDSIKTATQEYRQASDILGDFVDEKLRLDMPQESRISKRNLYKLYRIWAKEREIEHPINERNFGEYFRTKGIQDRQGWEHGKNVKSWFGIGLKDELPF